MKKKEWQQPSNPIIDPKEEPLIDVDLDAPQELYSPPRRPSLLPSEGTYQPPNHADGEGATTNQKRPTTQKRISLNDFNDAVDKSNGVKKKHQGGSCCCCDLIHHSQLKDKNIDLFGPSFEPDGFEMTRQLLFTLLSFSALICLPTHVITSSNESAYDMTQPDDTTTVTKCKGFYISNGTKTSSSDYTIFSSSFGIASVGCIVGAAIVALLMLISRNTDFRLVQALLKDLSVWLVLVPIVIIVISDLYVQDIVSTLASLHLFVQLFVVLLMDALVHHSIRYFEMIQYTLIVLIVMANLLKTWVLSRDDVLIVCALGEPFSNYVIKRMCLTTILSALLKHVKNAFCDGRRTFMRWIEEPIRRSRYMSKATLAQRNIAIKIANAEQRRLSRLSRTLDANSDFGVDDNEESKLQMAMHVPTVPAGPSKSIYDL